MSPDISTPSEQVEAFVTLILAAFDKIEEQDFRHLNRVEQTQAMAGVDRLSRHIKAFLNELSQDPKQAVGAIAIGTSNPAPTLVAPNPAFIEHHLVSAATNTAIPDAWQPMAQWLLALAPNVVWYVRQPNPQEPPYPEPFASNHANAYIIGPNGILPSENVAIGITLMAPNVTYVDHRHAPEEVYLILSDGQWRQNQAPWHTPTPGGTVYNAPHVIHAMQSGEQPILAIWCLNLSR